MRSCTFPLALLFVCEALISSPSPGYGKEVDRSEAFFTNHIIPHLRIQLNEESLAALRNKFRTYVKCTVLEGTNIYRDVGIHLKGQYGTFQGIDDKPSLTLNFDKYVRGQHFFGMDKLHLNNSVQDPSLLCEILGRELMQAAGIPTGRASHAVVELNGRALGLFLLIEGYDKRFLQRHFKNTSGNLYDSEFRHDITEPLKRSSGDSPNDHADLQALTTAAQSGDPVQRLDKLAMLLDLDRFYSMLALESLMRHHDGYAMAVNNYWLYFEPQSAKAVFISHGMDQLFDEPQAPLLPDLEGILARAVLQTQTGRRVFRSRCRQFYTTLFPGLSNRVQVLRDKMQPTLAQLDAALAVQHDLAVTTLQRRIQQRLQYLNGIVFASAQQPVFGQTGLAILTNWTHSVEGGKAALTETNLADAHVLQVKLESSEKPLIARWQKALLLSKGPYRFSAKITADQSVFRGPAVPVSVKVWGMDELQLETTRPDTRTVEVQGQFEAGPENEGEYLIECRATGQDMSVSYQIGAIRLSREPSR